MAERQRQRGFQLRPPIESEMPPTEAGRERGPVEQRRLPGYYLAYSLLLRLLWGSGGNTR